MVGDAFVFQETSREIDVLRPDVGEALHGARTPEELGFEILAPRAAPQEPVDEQFHQIDAEPLRLVETRPFTLAGKEEMVHAADLEDRIAHAGGHARPQHRRQHRLRFVRYSTLTLDDMDTPGAAAVYQ